MSARPARGSITDDGRYPIDLTGPGSHTLVLEPGVGSLDIGPASMGKKAQLHVAPDARIDWTVFDAFATGAGSPWPRWLGYTGGDTGVFDWARERPIEELRWTPVLPQDAVVDVSRSMLRGLHVTLDQPGGHLHLKLPGCALWSRFRLGVSGDLTRLSVAGEMPWQLILQPATSARERHDPYRLPDLGPLHQVAHLSLHNAPMAQPIALEGLSRFPNLEALDLSGAMHGLEHLAGLPRLKDLQLRFMPDLAGLPDLASWPELDSFIAYNVDETAGKRLRQQLKARAKVRPWSDYASVTQLRKPEWWQAEYGRPFSAWPKRSAKLANEAYDAALAALAQARDLADAEAALGAFTRRFNTLKGIETSERDDLGDAVWQLSGSEHAVALGVTEELAQRWFDAARDY